MAFNTVSSLYQKMIDAGSLLTINDASTISVIAPEKLEKVTFVLPEFEDDEEGVVPETATGVFAKK